jgi:periplasmic divalent cation tolerance protein
MERAVFVYTTFPSVVEAQKAGNALVGARLAACVNILPGMISVYRWQGAAERAEEVVMIVKTRASLAEEVRASVRATPPMIRPPSSCSRSRASTSAISPGSSPKPGRQSPPPLPRRRDPEWPTTAPFAPLHLDERHRAGCFTPGSARGAHCGVKIGHEPIDPIPRASLYAAPNSQKGHTMFRTVAIALVAASVLAAPVLAQNVAPGAGKAPLAATGTAPTSAVKTVKADKAITKHRFVVRHHRHGTKLAKHVTHVKYAHHMKHGKTATKQATGKPAAVKQVSVKPATRSGVN